MEIDALSSVDKFIDVEYNMADLEKVQTDSIQSDVSTETKVTNPEGGVTKQDDSDIDKKIQSAIDKTASKIKKEYESKLQEAQAKISKFEKSQMTEEQQKEADRKEYEERTNALAQREQKLMVLETMTSVGLPQEFAKYISGKTEDEILVSVTGLKKHIAEEAQKLATSEINKRLGGAPPKGGTATKTITEEEIEKLPTREERMKARKESGLYKPRK